MVDMISGLLPVLPLLSLPVLLTLASSQLLLILCTDLKPHITK